MLRRLCGPYPLIGGLLWSPKVPLHRVPSSSWFAEEIYALLRAHGVALVIGSRPEAKEFQAHVFTAAWTMLRFHDGSRRRRGKYSETELREWARRLRMWSSDVEILAYFNNDWEVFAVRNALRLKQLLAES